MTNSVPPPIGSPAHQELAEGCGARGDRRKE